MEQTIQLVAFGDGSGTGVPGDVACVGAIVTEPVSPVRGRLLLESSAVIGGGTNNVAELWAIRRALHGLRAVGGTNVRALLYTDSSYAIGMITGAFKNRPDTKNYALVEDSRDAFARTAYVELRHVRGHVGVQGNEVCDWLAAIARATVKGNPPRRRPVPWEQEHIEYHEAINVE